MKRKNLIIILFVSLLVFTSITIVQSKRPIKATLSVEITAPSDGTIVENDGSFIVSGDVLCQKGDAGTVDSFVQYSIGEGTNDFHTVDGSYFQIIVGEHPQSQNLLQDESYSVQWELEGSPGIYEIRIYSEAVRAKSGASEPRTVTIEGPSPPPDIETIDSEYQDSGIGFGETTGTFVNTYFKDGTYEILEEEKNDHGTRKPVDDTTELGWIFVFEDLDTRLDTDFYFYGHAFFTESDSDTAFYIQYKTTGSWSSILTISNTVDEMLCADIPDNSAPTVYIRIIDNDQTIGNKEISSLSVDQVYIHISDVSPPPSSGIEILLAEAVYLGKNHLVICENEEGEWFNELNVPTDHGYIIDIAIVDIDGDGDMETVTSGMHNSTQGDNGLVQVWENVGGSLQLAYTLPAAEPDSGVFSFSVGDIDNDQSQDLEIVTSADCLFATPYYTIIWKKVGGEYVPSYYIPQYGASDAMTAGNIDADSNTEIVISTWNGDIDGSIVAIWENQSGGWVNTANYTFNVMSPPQHLEIMDIDGDSINELIVSFHGNLYGFDYTGTSLVNVWTSSRTLHGGFSVGDVTNDNKDDIVALSTDPAVVIYEEVSGSLVDTINIPILGGGAVYKNGVDVGDVDNDGQNEYVLIIDHKLYIFRNDAKIYEKPILPEGTRTFAVAIGDFDNDAPEIPNPGVDVKNTATRNSFSKRITATSVFEACFRNQRFIACFSPPNVDVKKRHS